MRRCRAADVDTCLADRPHRDYDCQNNWPKSIVITMIFAKEHKMSEQAVRDFVAQLQADPGLQRQLHEALASNDLASIVELARQRDHEFGIQELQSVLANASTDELSDAELDCVAGGGGFWNASANDLMAMFLKLNMTDPNK